MGYFHIYLAVQSRTSENAPEYTTMETTFMPNSIAPKSPITTAIYICRSTYSLNID